MEQPLNINGRWKLGMMEPLVILGLVCPEGSYLYMGGDGGRTGPEVGPSS